MESKFSWGRLVGVIGFVFMWTILMSLIWGDSWMGGYFIGGLVGVLAILGPPYVMGADLHEWFNPEKRLGGK